MASESNGTRWTLWWRGSSWQYYTFCFFWVLCFLLLISLTCFNTTLFKWLLIPFSTLSKLFPCKIRSNYIAHIEMIYCVKLSRLFWCLNSREWLKIQVVFWARLPIRGVYDESCIQNPALKALLRCCAHWLSLGCAGNVVWHSWATAGLGHSLLSKCDAIVGATIISVESPSQAKVLSGCDKVFDISHFS